MSGEQKSSVADGWYYQINGNTVGPVRSSEFKKAAAAGIVAPETLIRKGASGDWVTATDVKGLFPPQVAQSTTLAPAKCPSCGAGVDIPDGRDTFHCMYCGGMIVVKRPTTTTTAGTTTAAASPEVKNLIGLAEMAEVSKNNAEAHKYWNRVLEYEPSNVRAWIGKGIAAGCQSSIAVPRTDETLNCIRKAIALGFPNDTLLKQAAANGHAVAVGFFNLALDYQIKFQQDSIEYSTGILDAFASTLEDQAHNADLNREFVSCTMG
jgi:DNA-directed RNA polymerase subunit RPC12/RpoP